MNKKDWLALEPTQVLIRLLKQRKQEIMEMWADGVFTDAELYGTIQRNSEAIGKIQAYSTLLEEVLMLEEPKNA